MAQATPLTGASFTEFIRVHRFVLVHFWAGWNGHDRKMKEVIESEIPSGVEKRVAFGSLDTDPPEHHELMYPARDPQSSVPGVLSRGNSFGGAWACILRRY